MKLYYDKQLETTKTFAQIKNENRNVSFPADGPSADWLEQEGYAVLIETPKPNVTEFQDAIMGVEEVDGEYQTTWTVIDLAVTKQDLVRYLEQQYKKRIVRPITAHGCTIVPNDETLNRLNNKIQAMRYRGNAQETTRWIGITGPVDLTLAQLEGLGLAADEQWQPYFDALPGIQQDIDDGTITEIAEIDAALDAV